MAQAYTAYVGNLSWGSDDDSLANYFAEMNFNVECATIQRHDDSGRSKGWALVTFDSDDTLAGAVDACNQTDFDGRTIIVRADRGKTNPETRAPRAPREKKVRVRKVYDAETAIPSQNLYIGNLSWDVQSEVLSAAFAEFDMHSCEVIFGRNGRSRGYGLIECVDQETADRAIELLNNTEMDGRTIYVRYDQQNANAIAQQ